MAFSLSNIENQWFFFQVDTKWVFSSVTNWHLQIRWWNWTKPTSYHVNTMDALIVSIQMILVGRIIHPAKLYIYSLLLENEPTSINSHLTRNEKWKLWVGWQGSSCWLLCLCVLCFVFCAASKTIRCSRVLLYYLIFWKMKIMSYVFWQVSSSIKLQPEKFSTRKKRYSRLAVGWNKSQITICRVKIQTPTITGKITTGNKGTVVWPSVGIRVNIRTPTTTGKNYDRKKRYSHLAYTICNTRPNPVCTHSYWKTNLHLSNHT